MNEYKQQVEDLRKRASIRREATGRKSVEEGKVDRLAQQLDAAADSIEKLAGLVFNGSMDGFQPPGAGSNPVARSKNDESNKMKASDFYFKVDTSTNDNSFIACDTFIITNKALWDSQGIWHDHEREDIEPLLPAGFFDQMESVYEYNVGYDYGDTEEGRQKLLAAGFIENPKL